MEFVIAAGKDGVNISEVCGAYGISRKTGYKWLRRYRAEGAAGLQDQSRRPGHSPTQTLEAVEDVILALREENPAWGARKLKRRLEDMGETDLPAVSTITEILRRHGKLDPMESRKHQPYQRFERGAPNELLQMDFKGDFALTEGGRCYPLTVLDDHSRFLVGLFACPNMRFKTVQQSLTSIFERHGLPEGMLMDNGDPWKGGYHAPYSQTTVWLMRLGVRISHGRYYHPQTQGKDERLHRTLGAELLHGRDFATLAECQSLCDAWRYKYNHQRPHDALDLDTPAKHYRPSSRPFPETLPTIAYPPAAQVRKVDSSGKFSFHNQSFKFSTAFCGQRIELRPTEDPDRFHIYFLTRRVAVLSFLEHDVTWVPVTHVSEHV
jgi:transposase InsO family protein